MRMLGIERSQVICRLGELTRGRHRAFHRGFERIGARQMRPKLTITDGADRRMSQRSDRRAHTACELPRAVPPPSWLRSAAPAPRADARDRRERAPCTRNSRVQRRARSPPAAPRWVRPWPRGPRARAGFAAHRWDGCAPPRPRPPSASRACIAGQPRRARLGIDVGANLLAGPRQGRDAADQRAQVEHRAADQQRHAPARFDVGDGVRGIAHELPRRIDSRSARPGRAGDAARPRASPRRAWRCRCRARDTPAPSRR